ncbi:MAG: glycoside hydrolase family 1 protein [Candidatus Omnitrophica bacterium]|nr:glycoside hydrolase family 1 protein [Candidatus Omnitrophota bacterium]MDD5512292.1 glycoside hydrolase family 1 protein [Candidatus Omnitrophota bacterium]
MINFPKDFLWGASTSAYQVEGQNSNCDWWRWEKKAGLKDLSGDACRHYDLFDQDFALARKLNHNAHRLSIEWSRIEPGKGEFSSQEISHYIEVIDSLHRNALEPLVTLHHFTNPLWFADSGAWLEKSGVDCFLEYVRRTVEALADKVRYWITINEPLVYVYHAYLLGVWPPQESSLRLSLRVVERLLAAHIGAHRIIREIYRKKNLPFPLIGIAKNMQAFEPCDRGLRTRLGLFLREKYYNYYFLDRLAKARAMDFIGLNYYTRSLIEVTSWRPWDLFTQVCTKGLGQVEKNSLGWDIYPQGLYRLLVGLKKYKLPVVITENGICTQDDQLRWRFIRDHLKEVSRAIASGADVRGYLYWSLLDNFEWDKGFAPRFGMVDMDYATFQRKPRPSAEKFAAVCKSGTLE